MDYKEIDGVRCYAPTLAVQNDDYPHEAFSILYELEEDNFWFQSRNKIIQNITKKYVKEEDAKFLEIGCGTGFVLQNLNKKFPSFSFFGSEIHLEGIKFAKKRVPNATFIQLDATEMPFENEFDAIGAFDVLEHIDADTAVMKGIYKALKPDGHFIITVPQHQFMWSINDDIAFHKRRYSRIEMLEKLKNEGFTIEYVSSFVFMLFPMMLLSRLTKTNNKKKVTKEIIIQEIKNLKVNSMVNAIFIQLMKIDEMLIKKGISLPFGGSLLVVAKK